MIVRIDVIGDCIDQLLLTMENAATNSFLSDFSKPALDQIEPRSACRDEMHVKARMLREPGFHLRVLMCGVVVCDQMQVQVCRCLFVDLPQEFEPLLMAMTFDADTNHLTLRSSSAAKRVVVPLRL